MGNGVGATATLPRAPGRAGAALDGHYAGLDGMRGVAMVVMLAYHGELDWGKGAFLGLSQFFTLSGFLITAILLRARQPDGRVALLPFWGRRYRRLLPAAYLGLVTVVLFGATVATEQQLEELPGAVVAAVAQVANWFFVVTDQSYVGLFSDPSPVQHYWSLAVEEQFYLLMPIALVLLLRRTTSRLVLGGFFAAGAVASTAVMLLLERGGANVDRLYYGTDTRAAEMLVGGLLAVLLHGRSLRFGTNARRAIGAVATVAFLVTVWGWATVPLDDPMMYRGGFLVFAVLTAALIVSVLVGVGPGAALYAWGPFPAIGRVTYGLYIFHWPIFLWLDDARTGLDGWALFALRMAVTTPIAVASYHFVEMPIRRGSWPAWGPPRRWIVAGAAASVLVGAVWIGQRDVVTDLAGLGRPVGAMPTTPQRGDAVLDLLVVADEDGAGLAAELSRLDAGDETIRVTVAEPLVCEDVDPAAPVPCRNWAEEWPALVTAADPDAVVLRTNAWHGPALVELAGSDDWQDQAAWLERTIGAGLDLLTREGATVLWSRPPPSIEASLRQETEPFFQAMLRLSTNRPDVRRQQPTRDVEAVLADARLYERREPGDVPRVLVLGDSTARTLGYGLERWAEETGAAIVWSAGTEGCGIADDGRIREIPRAEREVAEQCRNAIAAWPEQVASFDPDVVVVMSALADLQTRRLDDWDRYLGPGAPAFDDYLVGEYTAAFDAAAGGGATVVWMNAPCGNAEYGPLAGLEGGGPLNAERIRHMNEVLLPRLAAERPLVQIFDLASVLCPGGEFTNSIDGVAGVRPDGVHFSPHGSRWFAGEHGPAIVAAAGTQ